MSEIDLTQKEANRLIAIPKKLAIKEGQMINMPLHSDSIVVSVESIENKEKFIIDFSRKDKNIELKKQRNN